MGLTDEPDFGVKVHRRNKKRGKVFSVEIFFSILSFDILILSKHEKRVMFVTKEGITCYSLHKIMHGNIECSV